MINPAFKDYLTKPYFANSNQKGGTLIAEDVLDREEHGWRLCNPDSYRPKACPRCGFHWLHAHGRRERKTRGEPDSPAELVYRYKCVNCGAVWTILPAFLARHLHRSWWTVQAALVRDGVLEGTGKERRVSVPKSTRRRWAARLRSSARILLQVLAGIGAEVGSVLRGLSEECSRWELVEEMARQGLLRAGNKLAELAAWLHRAVMGVRLM